MIKSRRLQLSSPAPPFFALDCEGIVSILDDGRWPAHPHPIRCKKQEIESDYVTSSADLCSSQPFLYTQHMALIEVRTVSDD